jgi:hypothetical protein
MGTHGRGVIIIDDISPLRELTPEVLDKDVHFFETKPFTMTEASDFSGSFGAETQFVGENKNTNARIVYYLKKRHTFGKMEMEIQDMNGNRITTIAPGKSKGINVVSWNFAGTNPKVAQAKTLTYGGFASPRVPAGKYKVVLTKGNETYTHEIGVKYDDKSITTLEQRKEQEALTKKLYNMVEDLAYMVYEITETQAKASEVIANNPKGKKDAQKLFDALENLRKDLVITTGDNYVASADPELREKMADLYSNVATNFNKVSGASQANFELIAEDFSKEKKRYDEIMAKEGKKFNSFLEKNNIPKTELQSKEDFLKKG